MSSLYDRETDIQCLIVIVPSIWKPFSAFFETFGCLTPKRDQFCVIAGLFLALIKTFQFVTCYGTKHSHRIIILTGNPLSRFTFLLGVYVNKISLWASVARPANSYLN